MRNIDGIRKKIYSNCEINLNWSRITKTPFELPPILGIHGINLSKTSITNETLKGKILPQDTDTRNIRFFEKFNTINMRKFGFIIS